MAGYKNIEGKVCRLTIPESSRIYILDPDRRPIINFALRRYIWNEIDFWVLMNARRSFDFIYTIENRNVPGLRFTRHEHEFERIQSNLYIKRRRVNWIFSEYYRQMESLHKCKICGIIYKMKLIEPVDKN